MLVGFPTLIGKERLHRNFSRLALAFTREGYLINGELMVAHDDLVILIVKEFLVIQKKIGLKRPKDKTKNLLIDI